MSDMIQRLPDEMLRELLKYLDGKDIFNLRVVSRHFKNFVDNLGVEFWKRRCGQEYPVIHEDSHRKSGLNWKQLYRSLSLWKIVPEADVRVTRCPYNHLNNYSLNYLKNGVISFSLKQNSSFSRSNTVVYYDAKSRQEIKRKCYAVYFSHYIENDDVIAFEILEGSTNIVRIIPKAREDMSYDFKPHYLRNLKRNWHLEGDELFYNKLDVENNEVKFCKIKITIEDNEVSYEPSELGASNLDWILSVSYIGEKMHVLGILRNSSNVIAVTTIQEGQMNTIYSLHDRGLYNSQMDVCKIMEELRSFNFRPCNSDSALALWRIRTSRNYASQFDELVTSPILYGPHFLTVTVKNRINVYPNINHVVQNVPFTINLNRSGDEVLLDQFQVIETLRGHIIVGICCNTRLYIINLTHHD